MPQEHVQVEGIDELVRKLGRADKLLKKDITDRLRILAREVRAKAVEIAGEEGFNAPGQSGRGTGTLVRDIKYSVRGGSAFIRETAVNARGYSYPAVYEYGHSKWGHRPFMTPAVEESQPHVLRSLEQMMSEFVARF